MGMGRRDREVGIKKEGFVGLGCWGSCSAATLCYAAMLFDWKRGGKNLLKKKKKKSSKEEEKRERGGGNVETKNIKIKIKYALREK